MGSGSTAYRQAAGQYQALSEQLEREQSIDLITLKKTSNIELEHQRQLMELEQQRYELQKAGKLPESAEQLAAEAEAAAPPVIFETPAVGQAPAFDIKTLIVPAIIAFVILRKK